MKFEISKDELQNVIDKAEQEKMFASHKEVYKFIASKLNTKESTVAAKVREYHVILGTPAGKKGRPRNLDRQLSIPTKELGIFNKHGIQVKYMTDICLNSSLHSEEYFQKLNGAWQEIIQEKGK